MIPKKEEIIQINFQYSNDEKLITEVNLIKALDNCVLHTEHIIVKLRKTKEKTENFSYGKDVIISFLESNLNLVEIEFLPLKGQVDDQELKSAGKTLDEIGTVLNKVQSCSISSEKPEFYSKTLSRKSQKFNEYHGTTTVFT